MVGRKDGNLYEAFVTAYDMLNEINGYIGFEHDKDQFGYLTVSPSMVGTGLKASVRMRLPFLGEEHIFRDEISHQHNLICEKAITNNNNKIEHSIPFLTIRLTSMHYTPQLKKEILAKLKK